MSYQRALFGNEPSLMVDESLEGLCLLTAGIRLIPEKRIVVRKDLDAVKKRGLVSALSGGGSGHEPAHAGYVGRGMLTAAVCGDIFASPSVDQILCALRLIGHEAGTIVIVKNYTGDRLNFGLAIERYKAEFKSSESGRFPIEMVLVEDDITTVNASAGPRGICGTLLVHKLIGAMAEEGRSFEEIIRAARSFKNAVKTIGVSLNRSTGSLLPHAQTADKLNTTFEVEIGLGIHNEPGVGVERFKSMKDVVGLMMARLEKASVQPDEKPCDHNFLVVNNLGGLSVLEVQIVFREAILWMSENHGCPKNLYVTCGTLMTSLHMSGFSITVANCSAENAKYLLASTDCTSWIPFKRMNTTPTVELKPSFGRKISDGDVSDYAELKLTKEQGQLLQRAVVTACEAVIDSQKYLDELDAVSGDGDCGTTLKNLADNIVKVACHSDCRNPQRLFQLFAEAASTSGGTSGALYGVLFSSFAYALAGFEDMTQPSNCIAAFGEALKIFVKYSRVQLGQKSMLDALDAIRASGLELVGQWDRKDLAGVVDRMACRCEVAAHSTKNMVSEVGRASYSAEREDLLKVPDAGAVAVSLWMRGIAESLESGG